MPEFVIRLESSVDGVTLTTLPAFSRKQSVRQIDAPMLGAVAERWNAWRTPGAQAALDDQAVEALSQEFSEILLGSKEVYLLQDSIQRCMGSQDRLTLVFEIGDSAQMSLPFEILALPKGKSAGYLALDPSLSMERRLFSRRRGIVFPEDPVRVLIVTSNPAYASAHDLPGIQHEARAILALLQKLRGRSVEVRLCEDPEPSVFQREMASFRPTVLHLSGHFIPTGEGYGFVVREEGGRGISALSAEMLRQAALDAGTALCVLNGCRNSGVGSGIAEAIASTGEISVIGHQFEILDDDSILFAEQLYQALANGTTVREALTVIRKRMAGKSLAWLAPIFYAHASSLRIAPDHLGRARASMRKLVGRRKLSEEIAASLLYDDAQIVNLHGPQGIGKSALASWLEAAIADHQGMRVQRLDAKTMGMETVKKELEALLEEIALAPASEEEGGSTPFARLLVLDHWADGEPDLEPLKRIGQDGAKLGVKAIVVSRRRLGIEGVSPVEVGPLRLAEHREDVQEATQLFLDRWNGDAFSDASTLPTVNRICSLLGGHPGFIESAASLANYTPLTELVEHIQSSPSLLAAQDGGDSAVPAAMLDALPDSLRGLLLAASFFGSEFSATDLAEVSGLPMDAVAKGLGELIESGMILPIDKDRKGGYALLTPIRGGLLALQDESAAEMRERYISLVLRFGKTMQDLFRSDKWQEASTILQRRKDDFVATIRHLVDEQNDSGVLEAFRLFALQLFEAGEWTHFDSIAAPALEAARREGSGLDEMRALGLLGAQRALQRKYDECYDFWNQRAELAHRLGDLRTEADALLDIGWQLRETATDGALEYIHRGLQAALKGRAKVFIATAYAQLAVVSAEEGRNEEAACYVRKANRLSKKVKGHGALPFVLLKTGYAAYLLDDAHTAVDIYCRALQLVWEASRQQHEIEVAYRVAVLLDRHGELELAQTAIELAARAGGGKKWTYESEAERLSGSIQYKIRAKGQTPEDLSIRPTFELRRRLLRGLESFLKNRRED